MVITKPTEEQLKMNMGLKSSYRNAIAVINGVTFEEAEEAVDQALDKAGIKFRKYEPYYKRKEKRWTLEGEGIYRNDKYWEPIMFMEPLTIGYDGYKRIEAEDQWMLFFSFVYKGKDLTPWRKKLTKEFFGPHCSHPTNGGWWN